MLSWLARLPRRRPPRLRRLRARLPPPTSRRRSRPRPPPSTARKADPEPEKPADAGRPAATPCTARSPTPPAGRQRRRPTPSGRRTSCSTASRRSRCWRTVILSWDTIRFTDADGKKIGYVAQFHTDEGVVEIALFPEQAPNHVRNFIALAQAGYYDGLCFDRIRHERATTASSELQLLEAGCPLGTGDAGTGSIGYWLKDEFTPADKMSHDEGIVGACRGEEADTRGDAGSTSA